MGAQERGQNPEQGGLPGAVSAQYGQRGAGGNGDRQPVERRPLAEAPDQTPELNGRG
jgi:hypothetical protein